MRKNPNFPSALAGSLVRHGSGARARTLLALLGRRAKAAALARPDRLLSGAIPVVSLRSRRKAGITYRVPYLLPPQRGFSYALRWFRSAVRERTERVLGQRLAGEFLDLAQQRGGTFRRRETLHQTALLNRGFVRLLRR